MGIFGTDKIIIKVLYLTENLKGTLLNLEINRDLVKKPINQDEGEAWPYDPDLLIPLTINGKKIGEVYPVCTRDGIFDPLGITPVGRWWDEKGESLLWDHTTATAEKEESAIANVHHQSRLEKLQLPLIIAAGFQIVVIMLIWAWKTYAG